MISSSTPSEYVAGDSTPPSWPVTPSIKPRSGRGGGTITIASTTHATSKPARGADSVGPSKCLTIGFKCRGHELTPRRTKFSAVIRLLPRHRGHRNHRRRDRNPRSAPANDVSHGDVPAKVPAYQRRRRRQHHKRRCRCDGSNAPDTHARPNTKRCASPSSEQATCPTRLSRGSEEERKLSFLLLFQLTTYRSRTPSSQ